MASRTAAGKSEPLGETKTGFDASSGEGNNVSVGKAILRRPIPARGRLVENIADARSLCAASQFESSPGSGQAYHLKREGNSKESCAFA